MTASFVADNLRVMTLAGPVFHPPDITGPDNAHFTVACRNFDATRKCDQELTFRGWMDGLVPSGRQPQKQCRLRGFARRGKDRFGRRRKCLFMKVNFDFAPTAFARVVGIKVVVVHCLQPAS